MGANKRRGEPAIPTDYQSVLTPEQIDALRSLESFGWELFIVRRPKFQPVEVILEHSDGKYAILTETGELDHDNSPRMRSEAIPEYKGEEGPDPWANATDDMEFEIKEVPEPRAAAAVGHEPVPKAGADPLGKKRPPPKIIV